MKKNLLTFFMAFVCIGFIQTSLSAQCPGCSINPTCYVPGGGLCPDSLPGGTQGQYYDTDVTAYLPSSIDAAPFSGGVLGIVPLESVHIDAITGLPFGLNWTCDHPGNNFLPASGDTLGCVKICGTPISAPGVYNIVVTVTAGVDAGALGTQYAQTSFNFQMVIFANASGNYAFNYSPNGGCDSALVSFTSNITGSLPQVVGYNWDFGGGNIVSTLNPSPPDQMFSGPGDYPVTLSTNIYALTLTSLNTTANPGSGDPWWTGDVEELCIISCPNPDLYFKFTHGSTTYTSSTGSDNLSNSWSPLNIVLSGSAVSISIWDGDNGAPFGSPDDDGGTFVTNITAPGIYGYTTTTPISGYTGGASGSFEIQLMLDTQIVVTDTIHIYASPLTPTLTASSLNFCPGESVTLQVDSGYSYEWYLDGLLDTTTTTHTLNINQAGDYQVVIYDLTTGCSNTSNSITVSQYAGIPWNFAITWNATNMYMQSNISGSYTYQWMFFNGSTWVNIAPPLGTANTYTPTSNGQYMLIATDVNGCTDTTAIYNFNTLGIHDALELEYGVSIYPNPASGNFNLSMQLPELTNLEIRIHDMLGKEVYSRDMGQVEGMFNQMFSIYDLSSGTYFVDLVFPEGIVRKKLIVQ